MLSIRKPKPKPAIDIKAAVEKLRVSGIYKGTKVLLVVIDGADTEQLHGEAQADGKRVFRILKRSLRRYFPLKEEEAVIKPLAVDMVISACEKWNCNGDIYDGRRWKSNLFRKLEEHGFITAGTLLVALAGESQQTCMPHHSVPIFTADLILSPERGLYEVIDKRTGLPRYAVRMIENCGGTIDENGIPCHPIYGRWDGGRQ